MLRDGERGFRPPGNTTAAAIRGPIVRAAGRAGHDGDVYATGSSGHATAVRDLRAAEAARVLGLLDPAALPARARRWIDSGIDTPAARALAAGGDPAQSNPTVLVATVAPEHDVAIHDVAVARAVHAQSVIGLLGQGGDFSGALLDLANSVTDGLTVRAHRWWGRFSRL